MKSIVWLAAGCTLPLLAVIADISAQDEDDDLTLLQLTHKKALADPSLDEPEESLEGGHDVRPYDEDEASRVHSPEEFSLLQEKIEDFKRSKESDGKADAEAKLAASLELMQARIAAQIGADGVVVHVDQNTNTNTESACPSAHYLDHTFVQLDRSQHHAICKPCLAGCTLCYGPSQHECVTGEPDISASASDAAHNLVQQVHQDVLALMQRLSSSPTRSRRSGQDPAPEDEAEAASDGVDAVDDVDAVDAADYAEADPAGKVSNQVFLEDDEAQSLCEEEDSSCGDIDVVEVSGEKDPHKATSIITSIEPLGENENAVNPSDMTDEELLLLPSMQKAMDSDGFCKAGEPCEETFSHQFATDEMTGEPVENPEEVPEDFVDEDPEEDPEEAENVEDVPEEEDDDDSILGPESVLQMNKSATGRAISYYARNRLKGLAANAGRHGWTYLKSEVKAYVAAQEGDCLDAVLQMIQASNDLYGCYKNHVNNMKTVMCKPGNDIRQIQDIVKDMKDVVTIVTTLSGHLKSAPMVGTVAGRVNTAGTSIGNSLTRARSTVDRQFVRYPGGYHRTWTATRGCCLPFPDSHCGAATTASTKCGGCTRGASCPWEKGCGIITKLDDKVEQHFKPRWDKLTEKVAEMAQWGQAGLNTAPLCLVRAGLTTCADVKRVTTNLANKMKTELIDKVCPLHLKIPVPRAPDLGLLRALGAVFGFLKGLFNTFNGIFNKDYCIYYPAVDAWWEQECTNICPPCCSYHGRRRWTGSFSCRTCCHRVCISVPKTRWYSKRACFNAMKILQGLGSFFNALFSIPIGIIERLIKPVVDEVTRQLNRLMDSILSALPAPPSFNVDFLNFKLPFPNLNYNFNCGNGYLTSTESTFIVGLKR